MIESVLAFLQVKVEGSFGYPVELGQAALCIAPEGLNSIDVALPTSEFKLPVVHPAMLLVAHIHQPIVGLPTVAVDGATPSDMASN